MKNDELRDLLKSAAVPSKPEEYWREFPKRVTARLQWRSQPETAPAGSSLPWLRMALGVAFAAGCAAVLAYIAVKPKREMAAPEADQIAKARMYYREIESLFPHQVRTIVFDHGGSHMILAEKPDVPSSPPYYIKVCGPRGCQEFITFSGQQISWAGKSCEVLADQKGKVFLLGDDQIWEPGQSKGSIRIEALPLNAML